MKKLLISCIAVTALLAVTGCGVADSVKQAASDIKKSIPTKEDLAKKMPSIGKKISSLKKIGKNLSKARKVKKVLVKVQSKGIGKGKGKSSSAAKVGVAAKLAAVAEGDTSYGGTTSDGDNYWVTVAGDQFDSSVYKGDVADSNTSYIYHKGKDGDGGTFTTEYSDADGDGLLFKAASGNPVLNNEGTYSHPSNPFTSAEEKKIRLDSVKDLELGDSLLTILEYESYDIKDGDTLWYESYMDKDGDSIIFLPGKMDNKVEWAFEVYDLEEDSLKFYKEKVVKTLKKFPGEDGDPISAHSASLEQLNGGKEEIKTVRKDGKDEPFGKEDTLIVTEKWVAGKDADDDASAYETEYAMIPGDMSKPEDDIIVYFKEKATFKDDPELVSWYEELYPEKGLKGGEEPEKARFVFKAVHKDGMEIDSSTETGKFDNKEGTEEYEYTGYKDGKVFSKVSGRLDKDGNSYYREEEDEATFTGMHNEKTGKHADTVVYKESAIKEDWDLIKGIYEGVWDAKEDTGTYKETETLKLGDGDTTVTFFSHVTKKDGKKVITESSGDETTSFTEGSDDATNWTEDFDDGSKLELKQADKDGKSSLELTLKDPEGEKIFEGTLTFDADGGAKGKVAVFEGGNKSEEFELELKSNGSVYIDGEKLPDIL